jgi:hypothetical protein
MFAARRLAGVNIGENDAVSMFKARRDNTGRMYKSYLAWECFGIVQKDDVSILYSYQWIIITCIYKIKRDVRNEQHVWGVIYSAVGR